MSSLDANDSLNLEFDDIDEETEDVKTADRFINDLGGTDLSLEKNIGDETDETCWNSLDFDFRFLVREFWFSFESSEDEEHRAVFRTAIDLLGRSLIIRLEVFDFSCLEFKFVVLALSGELFGFLLGFMSLRKDFRDFLSPLGADDTLDEDAHVTVLLLSSIWVGLEEGSLGGWVILFKSDVIKFMSFETMFIEFVEEETEEVEEKETDILNYPMG